MNEIDKFLINPEDQEDDKQYIKPNIEAKLSAKKRQECRDIVREINDFKVSQRQLVYLIYLLSLNLENVELMKKLTAIIGEERENVSLNFSETKEGERVLILSPNNTDENLASTILEEEINNNVSSKAKIILSSDE